MEEGIYARDIRLEYTPPVALPVPFPRVLSVEGQYLNLFDTRYHHSTFFNSTTGLPLYVASSLFVRATLGTLYTDLNVNMHKIQVRTPTGGTSTPSSPPSSKPLQSPPAMSDERSEINWSRRQLSLMIGLLVSGKSRLALSEANAEWDVYVLSSDFRFVRLKCIIGSAPILSHLAPASSSSTQLTPFTQLQAKRYTPPSRKLYPKLVSQG